MSKLRLAVVIGTALGGLGSASAQNGEVIALAINQSGDLCAEVVSVSPLQVGGGKVFEVVCVEYRGGTDTVTYLVDTRNDPPTIVRK